MYHTTQERQQMWLQLLRSDVCKSMCCQISLTALSHCACIFFFPVAYRWASRVRVCVPANTKKIQTCTFVARRLQALPAKNRFRSGRLQALP